jgi:hypothetical protein
MSGRTEGGASIRQGLRLDQPATPRSHRLSVDKVKEPYVHFPLKLSLAFALLSLPTPAFAHGGDASIVLLLPTGYYLLGAAFAVAASFFLLTLIPAKLTQSFAGRHLRLGMIRDIPPAIPSLITFILLAILVMAGAFGTRDPVENPLPAMFWTVWWVCFTILQAASGPLWPHLNPWSGPIALIRRFDPAPHANLPDRCGHLIAIAQFAAFAWFELVDPAPSDPTRLASAIFLYWLFNLAGALVFGETVWMGRAEPFSIFFGLIGRLSPFHRQAEGMARTGIDLVWPGMSLVARAGLPLTGVLFVLLTLSTVSFDGLSRTFLWLGAIGVNPLEFPGRSAVMVSSTLGLAGMFAALTAIFFAAVVAGCVMAGRRHIWREAARRLVYSIVPIAVGFQGAHYLTSVLVDGQNALTAMSDPFSLGWNLFGTAHWQTTTSFLNTLDSVTWIFDMETMFITLGHVIGIVIAHLIAMRLFPTTRQAILSQVPLAALMVFYTGFGLWLLSTPQI